MNTELLNAFKKIKPLPIKTKKKGERYSLHHGDCLEELKKMADFSIDSLITDPPAGISFMNKEWDDDKGGRDHWIKWLTDIMKEAYRVMKPGGHGLVWALPRTSHWTATALENAGFEVRDCVYHFFGSGFPKSMDISKAIDKQAGAEREIVGKKYQGNGNGSVGKTYGDFNADHSGVNISTPSTPEAKQWDGWGTALKPAVECWWLVRKPLSEKTVAKNVLKWGTGGINIDGGRVASEKPIEAGRGGLPPRETGIYGKFDGTDKGTQTKGRFPSHLLLSHSPHCTESQCDLECPVSLLDEQSGDSKGTGKRKTKTKNSMGFQGGAGKYDDFSYPGSGGASRFFYCPKPSSSERNAGLSGVGEKVSDGRKAKRDVPNLRAETFRKNIHPTIKSVELMRYLVRLITPPNGKVLDPFLGSGTTGIAAMKEGFRFVGIEKEERFFKIARSRIGDATL